MAIAKIEYCFQTTNFLFLLTCVGWPRLVEVSILLHKTHQHNARIQLKFDSTFGCLLLLFRPNFQMKSTVRKRSPNHDFLVELWNSFCWSRAFFRRPNLHLVSVQLKYRHIGYPDIFKSVVFPIFYEIYSFF